MTTQLSWRENALKASRALNLISDETIGQVLLALADETTAKSVLSAAKVINFAKALVAIFALQSAMFASFGSNDSEALKQLMNIIVGGCVCATVFAMAVYMVVNANEKLKKLGADNTVIRDTEHFV